MKKSLLILFLVTNTCWADTFIPPNALKYLPTLSQLQKENWSTLSKPSMLGGQIEQESCTSLKSPKCWSPNSELKTNREHGIGLAQFTIAFKADGSERFNKFAETASLDKRLSSWKEGKNLFDPNLQMLGFVKAEKQTYNLIKFPTASDRDKLAFTLSAYNGGLGGVLQDHKLCASTAGCDASKWYGNVEKTSFKQKTKVKGYGQSFFEINRGYITNIDKRSVKYIPYLG